MTLVVDSSVALSWHFDDEANAKTDELYARILREFTHVPDIWLLEVTNSLVMGVRRKRIGAAKLKAFIDELDIVPITIHAMSNSAQISAIVSIATEHDLTTYDAAYLELARHLNLPLATYDRAMIRAAKEMRIQLLEI